MDNMGQILRLEPVADCKDSLHNQIAGMETQDKHAACRIGDDLHLPIRFPQGNRFPIDGKFEEQLISVPCLIKRRSAMPHPRASTFQ